ncbi:DUF3598 family protein [Parvularcula lutaonensis]|uniref:DUF3598 family protein n=1 Tax=Parvularcula lutaonensis TaxID=491923 RepID=A0ABV7MAR0_9PROT|nr:DUF3598 family protein [Parvularcula lutaonensis]GGY38644.1 hypothetical protein GCM10007148_03710 [Parvularcula lutaonensis]
MNFPATRAHEGTWRGVYTHLDEAGRLIDRHRSVVECAFPDDGEVFYRQTIRFDWEDGRVREDVFEGQVDGDKLRYDTETFCGVSWETDDGLILLSLQRKDEPGTHFYEIICMGEGGRNRARTWHWFREGRLYRRTLCDEMRDLR